MSSLESSPNQGAYRPPPLAECRAIPGNSVHLNCNRTRIANRSPGGARQPLLVLGVFRQIAWIRSGRQQELQAKISNKISLIAAARPECAPGHEEENNRGMDFVAPAKIDRGLVLRGMKRALIVQLRVQLELVCNITTNDETCNPAIRSLVDNVVAQFEVHVERPHLVRELKRQFKGLARGRDTAAHGVVGIVQEELREHGYGKVAF